MLNETPITPETHRYVGMWRPPWETIQAEFRKKRQDQLDDGGKFVNIEMDGYNLDHARFSHELGLKNAWLAGHFDVAQYEHRLPRMDQTVMLAESPKCETCGVIERVDFTGAFPLCPRCGSRITLKWVHPA